MKILLLLIAIIPLFLSVLLAQNPGLEKAMTYPYFASTERTNRITGNYRRIRIGMTREEVNRFLGNPDEILPIYEPMIKNPKRIGTTCWYLIQRKTDSGSVIEKDEKLVRVSFDMAGRVTGVDHWGFDESE